ncbi:MAG: hypothetical protein N2234_05995, partial [Planctomycetota bacterium]|nr:hypothetical protein [Planctomycetota bacterium]
MWIFVQVARAVIIVLVGILCGVIFGQEKKEEGKEKVPQIEAAVWVDGAEVVSPLKVRSLLARLKGVRRLFVCVKSGSGRILWQSKMFKEAIADGLS